MRQADGLEVVEQIIQEQVEQNRGHGVALGDALANWKRHEGHHNEAVLAYWPMAGAELSKKESGLVRTARGVLGLCSHFDEEHECDSVDMGSTSVVMQQLEPHIYWLLAAPAQSGNLTLLQDAGKRFLHRLHGLFMLLHQRVQSALDAGGPDTARSRLSAFLSDFMPDAAQDEGWCTARDLYTPLTPHLGLPLLPLPTSIFMGLQCMTASMAVSPDLLGDRALLGAMVLFKSSLLWSALDEQDSQALYLLASRTIIPVTRIANKATEISKLYHTAKGSVKSASSAAGQHVLQPKAWKLHKDVEVGGGFILCDRVPLGGGGAPSTRERGSLSSLRDGVAGCPVLHLQAGREPCRMLTWQNQGLQIVLLLRGAEPLLYSDLAAVRREVAKHLVDLDKCSVENWNFLEHGRAAPGHHATAALSRLITAHAKGHIHGARYAFWDHNGPFARASPVSKFATCAPASLSLMSQLWQDCTTHLRAEMLRRKDRHDRMIFPNAPGGEESGRNLPISSSPAGSGPPGVPQNDKLEALQLASMGMEGVAMSHTGKWVVAQWGSGCELMQVEDIADSEDAFLKLHERVRQFSRTHFPGALSP